MKKKKRCAKPIRRTVIPIDLSVDLLRLVKSGTITLGRAREIFRVELEKLTIYE